ncbi:hypothetical protein D3C72_2285520 [compost metagenome]
MLADNQVASAIARHKSLFFIEKETSGQIIDYAAARAGHLSIVPEGQARDALAQDYAAMLADEIMVGDALAFDERLKACADFEKEVNGNRETPA